MFDRLAPQLRFESELHLRCPFGHRGKLEEITGDNDLSIFHEGRAKRGRMNVLGFLQTDPWSGEAY